MNRFKRLATRMINKTFVDYAKTLDIVTVNGSVESGIAIDITNSFKVDQSENNEVMLVTDVDQWTKTPDAGNIDVRFNGQDLKIKQVDKDAAQAAYFITCETYKRETVTIQELYNVPDIQGGMAELWGEVAEVGAEIEYMDASEAIAAGRVETGQMLKLRFRYVDGIEDTMRVIINDEIMPIRSVVNADNRDQWLELLVERVKAA